LVSFSDLREVEKQLATLLFPKGLLDFFDVVSIEEKKGNYHFYLDEKNKVPQGYAKKDIESKGFYNLESITDFPLRGKSCTLKLRRRKWLDKSTGAIIRRDWDVVAKGTRTTNEFATFLKGLNR
jgi:hypothetical protein